LENAENHSPKDEGVVKKNKKTKLRKLTFRFKENMKLPERFWTICPVLFFFTEELLPKITEETNLYTSLTNPNKAMNCILYGIQKILGICIISSLTPHSNAHDLRN
jgi:hypothetical protein